MRVTCVSLLAFCATAAADPTGMAAMQYFVGTWSCNGGPVGTPPLHISVTFVMNSGILREWDEMRIPGQASPYTISKSISYDVKNERWVQMQVDSDGAWIVSYLKPWTGNTEEWMDQAAYNAKLRRNETIRTSANAFAFSGYANAADTKPDFRGTCTRSS